MKFNGKVLSLCTLLAIVTACHGAELTQTVTVANQSGGDISGGIYLTNLRGTTIYQSMNQQTWGFGECMVFTIKKPSDKTKKMTRFHRIMVSTDLDVAQGIATGKPDQKKITGTNIKLFSGGSDLHYEVTKLKNGKLKISDKKTSTCQGTKSLIVGY